MQFKVGTLLAVALGVTLLAMIFPTKGVNPFSAKFKLVAYFPEVAGLRPSSPVWFSGVEVGTVSYVDFVPGSDPPRLRVVLKVERRIRKYIKTDSKAVIQGMGLLGDMYVDLTQGSPEAPPAANGTVLEGVPPENTRDLLSQIMTSAGSLLQDLQQVSSKIATGEGTLGALVNDPDLYRELRASLQQLQTFIGTLNASHGSAMKFIRDPQLYDELVAAVREIREVAGELKGAEEKLFSPETREALDKTVKTAARVVEKVGEYQEKADRIRFDLNFGLDKYAQDIAAGHVDLLIWPNEKRYYQLGINKVSRLYGLEEDETTFTAQLAWRILDTPLFIRGGLIKDEYFVAGLDLRLFEDDFRVLLDAYRVEFNPAQVDLRTGVVLLDLIEITAGAEDVFRTPFYKAGLTIHYRDEDLLNVLFKMKF